MNSTPERAHQLDLDGSHPVASAAARLCRFEHGHSPSWGDVACLECWGTALIADKDAAAEAGLSEECPADPCLVDEIAVARAVAGEAVELTVAEWEAAKQATAEQHGIGPRSARQLLASHVTVVDALGNRLESVALGQEVTRWRYPRRTFPRSVWARERRRSARRERFAAAARELATGLEAA